jgi:hypothetical protein
MLHAGRHDLTTPVDPISVAAFTHLEALDKCLSTDDVLGHVIGKKLV